MFLILVIKSSEFLNLKKIHLGGSNWTFHISRVLELSIFPSHRKTWIFFSSELNFSHAYRPLVFSGHCPMWELAASAAQLSSQYSDHLRSMGFRNGFVFKKRTKPETWFLHLWIISKTDGKKHTRQQMPLSLVSISALAQVKHSLYVALGLKENISFS